MKSKMISFRCPEEVFEEMKNLCERNQVDRTGFIMHALQSMFAGLARQGIGADENKQSPSVIKEN